MFVLHNTGQDDKLESLLSRARVPFDKIGISHPVEMTGLAFSEEYLESILGIMGLERAEFNQSPTDRRETYLLTVKSAGSDKSGVSGKKMVMLRDTGRDNFIAKILEGKVPTKTVGISSPVEIIGTAFAEEDLASVLAILRLKERDFSRNSTGRDGLTLLVRKSKPKVSTKDSSNWHRNQGSFREIAAESLLALIDRDIIIDVPHAHPVAQSNDGSFGIHIWSSPDMDHGDRHNTPRRMWDIKVDCPDPGFRPCGKGIPIRDSDGYAVAELFENDLYIHHDLCHSGTEDELKIFRLTCNEARELYISKFLSPAERELLGEIELENDRANYLKWRTAQVEQLKVSHETRIAESSNLLDECRKKFVEAVRQIEDSSKILEVILQESADAEALFGGEFEKIREIPEVERIAAADGRIRVFTNPIKILRGEKAYDIGKFMIDIGVDGGIRCYNLTRRVDGYNHPCVAADGAPCMGTVAGDLGKLIGEYRFLVVLQIILRYLGSANPENLQCAVEKWPLAATA